MEALVKKEQCPYCLQTTEIAHIETPGLEVLQCSSCQKVWKVFEGKIDRMIRFKEDGPDTYNENLLCPVCWRILEPDYGEWLMVCTDPTCGYSRRILGLSPLQEKIRKEYFSLRAIIYDHYSREETPPIKITNDYNKLREEYRKMKKYEPRTV